MKTTLIDVTIRAVGAAQLVRLEGVLDAASAGSVRVQLADLLASGADRVVLDMTGTERIDSTGLGSLVTSLKSARERDARLVLAGLNAAVRSVVELTRLHRVFDIFADPETALAELEG